MKRSRLALWAWMLCKRLYRKPLYVFLLLVIPAITFAYSTVDETDSGVVTICLACEDAGDPLAQSLITDLSESSQLIRFIVCDSAEDAVMKVELGNADACWIFSSDLQRKIEKFSASWQTADAFVQVIERRQSLPLLIAREKLGGLIYNTTAKPYYLSYIRDHIPELDEVSDEILLEYFEEVNLNGSLFSYSSIYPKDEVHASEKGTFLTAPVRGLLAVVTGIAGLAASMYYVQDEQNGTFSWIPVRHLWVMETVYHFVAVLNIVIVTEASLLIAGLSVSIGREFLVGLLFSLAVTGFSMFIRSLLRSVAAIGVFLPIYACMMIAVCPVFYDLGKLRTLQFLLPPTYFITAAYNQKYLLYCLFYGVCFVAIYFLLRNIPYWLQKHRWKRT